MLLLAVLASCVPKDADTLPERPPFDTGTMPADTSPATTETGKDTATETGEPLAPLGLEDVQPRIVDPAGGSRVVVRGSGFLATEQHPAVSRVTVGVVEADHVELVSDSELEVSVPAGVQGPGHDLVVWRGDTSATLVGVLEGWSPAEITGAHLFDAGVGVTTSGDGSNYEWQRLTAEIAPDWRVPDGNTTTWLPSTGRYWMVAGWNGYQEPDGFSHVAPDAVYPLQNTTDEVWSSPDGVAWTLEVPHETGLFERRHAHNTVLWNDQLWMVGGDTHQGYYNHDVVRSTDGVDWTVVLGPGTTDPPWAERALQTIGVYDGRLWMAGGQDLLGPIEDYTYHNDVWVTEDGTNWTQVAPDRPASDTVWEGCGVLDGLVEFRGEMWLVGCAWEREDASGHAMFNDVWSTTDGVSWTRHAEPPWAGKIWPNVVAWDDRLWILFGYTYGDAAGGWPAGNSNEAWYSDDGESWTALGHDVPVPASHAQGVAVTDDALLLAGGNYSFGFGAGWDKSTWRLVAFHGDWVESWEDRGTDARVVTPADADARPVLVADAFGTGRPGLQFDGSDDALSLADPAGEALSSGSSVFWVGRAPYLPSPWAWEDIYAPVSTVVGGPVATGAPVASVGYTEGALVYVNLDDEPGIYGEPLYSRVVLGEGAAEGPGEVHLHGVTHAPDGTVSGWADGAAIGGGVADYGAPRAWSAIGEGMDDGYYGPNTRFEGTLGAVLIVPEVLDAATIDRVQSWAHGRFGAP